MKRHKDMSDKEWDAELVDRKVIAELRMMDYDSDIGDIRSASLLWYGKADIDSCCLAENRLAAGEAPE